MRQVRQADPGRGSARPWCIIGRVGIHGIVCRLNPGSNSFNLGRYRINPGQAFGFVGHAGSPVSGWTFPKHGASSIKGLTPDLCSADTGSHLHVFVLITHHVAEEKGEAWRSRASITKIPVWPRLTLLNHPAILRCCLHYFSYQLFVKRAYFVLLSRIMGDRTWFCFGTDDNRNVA